MTESASSQLIALLEELLHHAIEIGAEELEKFAKEYLEKMVKK